MNYELITQSWRRRRQGQILILALVMLSIFTILIFSTYSRLANFAIFGRKAYMREIAVNLADGGVDFILAKLNDPSTPSSYTGELLSYSNLGQVEVQVETSGINKQITSTAYIPLQTNKQVTHKSIAQATTSSTSQTVSLQYAMEALDLGINLNSAYVQKADVYTSGTLRASATGGKICGHAFANIVTFPPQSFGCNSPDTYSSGSSTFSCPSSTSCLTELDPLIDYDKVKQSACGKPDTSDVTKCPFFAGAGNCTITLSNSNTIKYIGGNSNEKLGAYNCNPLTIGGTCSVVCEVRLRGDVWVTGNLVYNCCMSLRPDGSTDYYNSTTTESPSIIVGGNISGNGQYQKDTGSGTQYVWLLGCQSASQTMVIWSTAVYYCLNNTVEMTPDCVNLQCTAYNTLGPIMAKGITINYASCCTATILGGAGLKTPTILSQGGANSAWVVKRGTYLFQR